MADPDDDAADRGALERIAGGDVESLGILIGRHESRILHLCERMLGDREEARDAAQEVFLKVFRHAGRFEPRGQVFTWIYRIAVNGCLNRLRRRQLVRFLSFGELGGRDDEGEEAELDPPSLDPDPEASLALRRRWRAARRAIAGLPANQRAVVTLIRLEGLSYREAATALGISEGAVESRLFRAMQRLAKAQETAG